LFGAAYLEASSAPEIAARILLDQHFDPSRSYRRQHQRTGQLLFLEQPAKINGNNVCKLLLYYEILYFFKNITGSSCCSSTS